MRGCRQGRAGRARGGWCPYSAWWGWPPAPRGRGGWGAQWLGPFLGVVALAASAAEQGVVPLEVLVTSAADDLMVRRTALNEDGVVEANVAAVRDGVVYLEFEDPASTALSAAGR
jgi:hypothetical protein